MTALPLSPGPMTALPLSVNAMAVLATLDAHRGHPATIGIITAALAPALIRRDVEAALQELRLAGEPVVTETGGEMTGVRLAAHSADVLACAQRLRRSAIEQLVTSRALRRTGRAMEAREQMASTLWDVAS